VTEYDLQDWRAHLEAKWKPATVNRKLTALSTCFTWAQEALDLDHEPTEHVNGLRQQRTVPQALSERKLKRSLRKVHTQGTKHDVSLLRNGSMDAIPETTTVFFSRTGRHMSAYTIWYTVRNVCAVTQKHRCHAAHVPAHDSHPQGTQLRGLLQDYENPWIQSKHRGR
jgi:site-specific recombinase XerD